MTVAVDRSQLRLIIAGLTEGVVIVEPDEAVSWANNATLAMHGVEDLDGLGRTVAACHANSCCATATTGASTSNAIRSSG